MSYDDVIHNRQTLIQSVHLLALIGAHWGGEALIKVLMMTCYLTLVKEHSSISCVYFTLLMILNKIDKLFHRALTSLTYFGVPWGDWLWFDSGIMKYEPVMECPSI
jgi:hypothetical protein